MTTALAPSLRTAWMPALSLQRPCCSSRNTAVVSSLQHPTPCASPFPSPCWVPLHSVRAPAAACQSSPAFIEPMTDDTFNFESSAFSADPFTDDVFYFQSTAAATDPRADATFQGSGPSTFISTEVIFRERNALWDQEPEDARSAIALGLRMYEDSQFEQALEIFSRALTLPGTGLKRFRYKSNEVSIDERISLLYNAACCYSRLERPLDGLDALALALEAGFEDISQIRQDPDLETLRVHPDFEGLLNRFEKPTGMVTKFLSGFRS